MPGLEGRGPKSRRDVLFLDIVPYAKEFRGNDLFVLNRTPLRGWCLVGYCC